MAEVRGKYSGCTMGRVIDPPEELEMRIRKILIEEMMNQDSTKS